MKTQTVYSWEREDASLVFVEEAVNRLANFKREEEDEARVKAFRRAIENGADFTAEDLTEVTLYLEALAARAEKRAEDLEFAAEEVATDKATREKVGLTIAELRAAADNARTSRVELHRIFMEAREAI